MRRFLLIFMLVLFTLLTGFTAVSGQTNKGSIEDIDEILYGLGSDVLELHISGWVKVNNKYMDMEELETFARSSIKDFSGNSPTILQSQDSDLVKQLKLGLNKDNMELTFTFNNGFIQSSDEKKENYETYIVINAVLFENDINDGNRLYKTIENFLMEFSDSPHISETYIAAIPGELGKHKMDRLSSKIFKSLQGKITEGIKSDKMISKTGYTDKIEDYLIVEDRKINLNVALRYNEYENMTFIWVGTPIISTIY